FGRMNQDALLGWCELVFCGLFHFLKVTDFGCHSLTTLFIALHFGLPGLLGLFFFSLFCSLLLFNLAFSLVPLLDCAFKLIFVIIKVGKFWFRPSFNRLISRFSLLHLSF